MSRELSNARSALFVPGTRPDRFRKACDTGADWIILDLEDAVAPADKVAARDRVDEWLGRGGSGLVRVNAQDTPWYVDDLAMVARHGCPVMLPKVAVAEDVAAAASRLGHDTPLVPLIECAAAVLAATEICAHAGVVRAAFGSFDLGAELGVEPENRTALLFARSALVLASAAAGIAPPFDGVTGDVDATGQLPSDIEHARGLGFGGKLCIHPNQVMPVNAGFAPSDDEVDWAREILDRACDGGVTVVDGKMIDAPVLTRARRILARAGAGSTHRV